ncbi:hypothetical protein [Pseudomonas solani]|uniref:hypothetical protein n=1 Tax=Pseudomonas solani TaxID=2731552 RepID=UPI003C2B13CE
MRIKKILITLLSSVAFNAFAYDCSEQLWSAEICAEKRERHEKWYKNYVESGQQEEMMKRVRERFTKDIDYDKKCYSEFYAKADQFLYGKSANFVHTFQDQKTKECIYKISQPEACMFTSELNSLGKSHIANSENCRFLAELQKFTHEYKDVIYTPEFVNYEKEFYAREKEIYKKHREIMRGL